MSMALNIEALTTVATSAFRTVYGQLKKDFDYKKGCGVRWRPDDRAIVDPDQSAAIRDAIEHAMESLIMHSYAQMTTIHETRDHWGKPYERYEMKLMCGEAYLVDFFCCGSTVYKRPLFGFREIPTDKRGISVMIRLWVNDKFSVELPIYVIDRFKFKDTGLWAQIERGLGLPKDIAPNDREYYFTKIDYEFRRKFFEFRGKQA